MKFTWKLAASIIFLLGLSPASNAALSVDRGGISWHFSSDRDVGRYANGDPWVVAPVTITAISPGVITVGSNFLNGSMKIRPSVQRMALTAGFGTTPTMTD